MPNSAIADTSSLIALEKINSLNILCKIYDTVLLPEAVFREFGASYPPCFAVVTDANPRPKWEANGFMDARDRGRQIAKRIIARAKTSHLSEEADRAIRNKYQIFL